MNTKRIVSILLILSMFMAILPKFSIAASNLGKFLSNKTFDEYAEDEEFKYQFVEHEKGDKKANITSPFYLLGNYGLNKQNDINDEAYFMLLLSQFKFISKINTNSWRKQRHHNCIPVQIFKGSPSSFTAIHYF